VLLFSLFTAVSLRTQELFLTAYSTRFLGLLLMKTGRSGTIETIYCFAQVPKKILVALTCLLIQFHEPTKFSYDRQQDSCRHYRCFVVLCALLAFLGDPHYFGEVLGDFSCLIEVGAVVPQLISLRRHRPANNGVQSFVTLMCLYQVMASS
jgi:ER lumen protein retaining receptor